MEVRTTIATRIRFMLFFIFRVIWISTTKAVLNYFEGSYKCYSLRISGKIQQGGDRI